MAASAVTRFSVLFAVVVVIGYVAAFPNPEPEPEPRHCSCHTCGASETKCGAVVVPTCVTMHHRCGTIRKCCPCSCCWRGNCPACF